MARRRRVGGWPGLLCWGMVGGLFAFGFVAMASIGLFVVPVAVAAAWLTSRHVESGAELLGLITGAGLVSLAVGLANVENFEQSCPARGSEGLRESEDSCGGLDPIPWLLVGTLLTLASMSAFGWIRHGSSR